MNLKDFLINKENAPELFWALVIEKGLVQSGIWYIGESAAEVIGVGTGIPWESEDDLIEATDAALSSAIQKIPENYPEPQKTVFGVTSSWVKDGEISPEHLNSIKKLCTELTLTPVGFVVLPEAIAHFYKSSEGAPLNAIVLKSGDDNLELSVFKLGELAGTTEVSRSVSLSDDVIEGLSRFEGVAPLPTRFVVYDGKEGELEDVKQTLLQTSWGEGKISFLHTPQVEILNSEKKVWAVALAGAAEIGDVNTVVSNQGIEKEVAVSEAVGEETRIEPEPQSAASLGFSVGEDVSSMKVEDVENVTPVEPTERDPKIFGQPSRPPTEFPPKTPSAGIAASYLARSKNLFHSFSKFFSNSNPEPKSKNKTLMTVLIALGLVFIAVIILWWFLQTAKITIFVDPKRAEENTQIIFDSNGRFDQENGIIPARILTDSVSGEKAKSTTGTKLIGNKATGSVQIANGNGTAINLSAGTILTSSSGFKFALDNEASVSGQLLPGSPGTATVNVTAYDIGSSYNLAKGEVFSVGNYSKALVAATSIGDFTGGSSQQISAVSEEDREKLEADLTDELKQTVATNLSAKISENEIFVHDLIALSPVKEDFDHNEGDQAENIKLSLELSAKGLAADRTKLVEYAKNIMSSKSPTNYSLSSEDIDFRFTFIGEEDGKYTYDVTIGGDFLPNVNMEKIKKDIQGRTTKVAEEYLNSIPGFDHAAISLGIKLPGPFKTIPKISKNITIDIRPQ